MNGLLRNSLVTLRRRAVRPPRRTLTTHRPFVPPSRLSRRELEESERIREELGEDESDDEGLPASSYARRHETQGPGRSRRDVDEEEPRVGDGEEHVEPEIIKQPPESPAFYSGRAAYFDQLAQIESSVAHTRSALKMLQLLPLPAFARASLPVRPAIWKNVEEMAEDLNVPMTSARYRTLTRLLDQMNHYLNIATAAGCDELAMRARNLLHMFESAKKEANLTRGKRKTLYVDHLGRSYTFGKRKTSTARVWMVPVQEPTPDVESIESAFGLEAAISDSSDPPLPFSTILINNIPIGEYFPLPGDRERAVRPLKIAGVLGAYNIFSLVRGGGTTGQSDALAHGISKGLLVHDTSLATLLRRTKLLRRDPRMVERKKTGRAKARKGYTWVKR
ncbi:SSU ribosomal protein S9P [Mycena rebaudengoi]|nr:SSU ribosomal protein S9P [Mycena rebaudengoi]